MKKDKTLEEKTVEAQDAKLAEEAKDAKVAKVTKVGAMLKSMRLQKGLKIVDISKKLCIRKCYLEAIEESNYKELPAVPYGIGFIRSYANYMGLNGENIVELYKEETNSSPVDEMKVLEAQPEATVPSFQYLLISLLAIVAIYIAWSFFIDNKEVSESLVEEKALVVETQSEDDSNSGVVVIEDFVPAQPGETADSPTKVAEDQIVVSEAQYVEPEKKDLKENKEEAASDNTKNNDDKKEEPTAKDEEKNEAKVEVPSTGVFLEVLKETWVEVKDQNKLYLSKVLQAGETYKVPTGSGMILSVGKYDGVNVYIDGTLTKVARATKKMNIALDQYLSAKN